jgi:hypothetical protein
MATRKRVAAAHDRSAAGGEGFPAVGDIAADLAQESRTTQPIDSITTNGRAAARARTR